MKEIKKILPLTIMSLAIVTLTAGALSTYAHFGNKANKEGMNFDPAKMEEMKVMHQAVESAIENNDYNAWQEAVAQDSMLAEKFGDQINEETFTAMVQIHQLMEEGKFDEARQLQEESGLKMGFWGKGPRMEGNRDFKLLDKNGDGVCEPPEQNQE